MTKCLHKFVFCSNFGQELNLKLRANEFALKTILCKQLSPYNINSLNEIHCLQIGVFFFNVYIHFLVAKSLTV
jgi:hypothetical protein